MAPEAANDELFEIKNSFYLGNFQQCITDAQKFRSPKEDVKILADVYMYRAYIAQKKFAIPLDEITGGSPAELQAVRIYADYLANSKKRENILKDVEKRLSSGIDLKPIFLVIAAAIYSHEGDFDAALRTLHISDDIECVAATIQNLLKIDRVDLAIKELKRLQEKDEDATISQLANAWVNMAVGKDKLQEAFYIFQEMIDKYAPTAFLLNAQSACLVLQQKYDQAESLLQDALSKENNNPETLVNLIVVTQHLGKPVEVSNRYISQLKDGHPNHQWTRDFMAKENEFDRLCMQYSASR